MPILLLVNYICRYTNAYVIVGNLYLQVHKCLLAATSDYFRVMFGGVMTESKQNMVDLKGKLFPVLIHNRFLDHFAKTKKRKILKIN